MTTDKTIMVTPDTALKGRAESMQLEVSHFVHLAPVNTEPSPGQQKILLAMGCFWGAEKLFWALDGIITTGVGYSGGITPNPTYQEVCTGQTGHAEVVRIVYDPQILPLERLMTYFWENHDPTQRMQQGNDIGTQYRSAVYCYSPQQKLQVERTMTAYQALLAKHQINGLATEVLSAGPFYFAEQEHQQYLAKNPQGYCGLKGTGVRFNQDAEGSP